MKKLLLFALIIAFGIQSNAQTVTITEITAPCDSNGVLVATFSGMVLPYTVYWHPSGYTPVTHTVTTGITDTLYGYTGGEVDVQGYGSTGGYASDSTHFSPSFYVSVTTTPANCPALGTYSATVSGGTGPYTYVWEAITSYSVVATTSSATVPSGSYYIRVTDVGTGCVGGFVNGPINVIYVPDFTETVTVTGAVCPALGSASVLVTGGTPPITYVWTNPVTGITVGTGTTVSLPGGNYGLTTSDALGCSIGGYDVMVTYTPDFTETVTTTPSICPALGGGLVSVAGGVAPFSYSWRNATTGVVTTSSTSPTSLPPCVYIESTTDALGCIVNGGSWSVGYTADFTGTVTTTNANCTNGTAAVAITGGTGPFGYLWSNGSSSLSIAGLATGTYNVKVTDGLGCVDSSFSGYVAQGITITVGDVVVPATCIDANGSITAFGSGGTPPYTYLWSTGGTTASITGLSANYYNVTATDANGCLGWGGSYVNASTPIMVTYASTASSCTSPTGTCTLSISGGTGPYTIVWYTTPVQTGITATSLSPGNYYFHVTDAMGCTQSGTVTVPPVDVIYLSFTSTAATCTAADGSVSVSAYGGVAPYTYSWTPGTSTSASLTGVGYGTYYATVTDAHGCAVTNCQLVPYSSPLVLGLSNTEASCLYTHDGTITETASLGTPPYAYSMGGSSSGSVTVPGLATGPYWIYVTDAMGCSAWDYTYVDYNVLDSSCFCVIKGTVYDDINHNCIQDPGEPGIQNIQMHCPGTGPTASDSLGYTYTDDSGNYYFLAPTGSYTVAQTVLAIYPLSPCQPNYIPVSVTAATGCSHIINFADTLDPIHDMHISTWDYNFAIPGFSYTQISVVTNDGTVTEPNILASYKPDGQIYGPTFVPAGVFTGAPYYYNTPGSFPSLAPGAGQEFLMTYNVPGDIPLGTSVVFTDTAAYAPPISNWINDYSPWNNVNYFTTTTVGSYDPNFKEVSPKGWGPAGVITTDDSVLEYMVHFQNTGSYMAQNVVVTDTIDTNLDWTTLRPVYMSDKCVVDVNEHGVATFTFNNIDLPPSSAGPISSNAMFTYTVKQRPNLPYSTHILNSASIYFDFNAPIKTNSTYNTIGWPASVPTVNKTSESNSFNIYPNPASTTFNALLDMNAGGVYNLNVCDITGKTEISKTLNLVKGSQAVPVDASRLAPGVYFVTFAGNDSKALTQKLVILK